MAWSLNDYHTLIWDGKPYLPIGARIDGNPAAVKAAKAAGISDVIVDLPANGSGWDDTLAALKANDMRYLIRIDSLVPMAKGFAVEPSAYRIPGITETRTISVDLPGVTSAFVVLAEKVDSAITKAERVPVVNGKLTYEARPAGSLEHILLIYPEMSSAEQPDFWQGFDAQRDMLLAALKRHAPGAGLRGIVNPMGRTLALPGKDLEFIPTDPIFRMEFREQLEKEYHAIKTAISAWRIETNDIDSFDQLARLVPLWQGSRGVGLLLDPVTNRTYVTSMKNRVIWDDFVTAVNAAGSRRFVRFVNAVRNVANVPIVQEWAGWAAPYETALPPIDGIGMRAEGGERGQAIESGCRASSTVARWSGTGWIPATDIDLGASDQAPAQLPAVVDDLGSIGSRAFFFRAETPTLLKAVATEAARRKDDVSLAGMPLRTLFFPENARNPATVERLPDGSWWLPSPDNGERIDLGSMFAAYRSQGRNGSQLVLWSHQPGRVRFRMKLPKLAKFDTIDGHDLDVKINKGSVDITMSQVPIIVTGTEEIPVPELAYTETLAHFEQLLNIAATAHMYAAEEQMFFKDHLTTFDDNPGSSFVEMQVQLRKLGQKIGDVSDILAERCTDTNFSEVETIPGCNGGAALSLRSPIPPPPGGYYATYQVQSRAHGDQEVWLAASIPPERRADLLVMVNGQPMKITGEPVGVYGEGYGWYKLGVTKLDGTQGKIRVQFNGSASIPVSIDSIVITPRPFTPNGAEFPDPIVFASLPTKK